MELKMEVYTPSLELIGVLEEYQSVIWEEKAFSAGSFSVEALLTDKTMELLAEENIIWIGGGTAGIIEYYDKTAENNAYISVKGRLLTGILDRRILWGMYDLNGTPPAIMHYLVDECAVHPTRGEVEDRKIPGLVLLDAPIGGSKILAQKTGGSLLDALEEIGAAYQVSFGVQFNPAVPQMEFWTRWGVNRGVYQDENEQVFYSTKLDDVLSSEYSYDSTEWRNVALVAGEGEGKDRTMVVVKADVPERPEPPVPPVPPDPQKFVITLSVDPEGGGVVSGAGAYREGDTVTITATPGDGYQFTGWQENGVTVSESAAYTFTVTENRTLIAVFAVYKPSRLPEGYTEVEYIEATASSGNKSGLKIATGLRSNSYIHGIFGSGASSISSGSRYYLNASAGTSALYMRSTSSTQGYLGFGTTSTTCAFNMPGSFPYKIDIEIQLGSAASGGYVKVNGENLGTLTVSTNTGTSTTFGYNSTSILAPVQIRIYYCKISTTTNTAADKNCELIPCHNSAGTAGLYDITNKKFYSTPVTSSGTWTAGPEV